MNVAVYVNTWDRYAAAWPPFCHGMRKYWPDRPWPLKFSTNRLDPPCGEAIKVGDETGWTAMLRRGLGQVGAPVVLFVHEDFWLHRPVDTAALADFAGIILWGEADHIQVFPTWKPHCRDKGPFPGDPRLLVFADDSPYRTSNQAGLWNVEAFLGLLRDGESPWDFEVKGSLRSRGSERFLGVAEDLYFSYSLSPRGSPIYRGTWHGDARRYAEAEGLDIDFSRQPKEGPP